MSIGRAAYDAHRISLDRLETHVSLTNYDTMYFHTPSISFICLPGTSHFSKSPPTATRANTGSTLVPAPCKQISTFALLGTDKVVVLCPRTRQPPCQSHVLLHDIHSYHVYSVNIRLLDRIQQKGLTRFV